MNRVLVTGAAGYIGSHATLSLLQAGFDVVALDNLSTGSLEAMLRVQRICGRSASFVEGDVRNRELLDTLLRDKGICAVMHFAGVKSVGESVREPLTYYDNNVLGSITLCNAMVSAEIFTLVFSSSATVYGEPSEIPVREDCPTGIPTNPYGRSKLIVEEVLRDVAAADSRWRIALLRYFNPVGAHHSGLLGEDPSGVPNNIMPYLALVAAGKLERLAIFGNDYPTRDGTGVRDYIHVVDLVDGHLKALDALSRNAGVQVWNLGTGRGASVLELVCAFESASGRKVPFHFAPRRLGDVGECWADPRKAERELGWKAKRDILEMATDSWRWQVLNPDGYR